MKKYICPVCNKEFFAVISQKRIVCSIKCASIFTKKKHKTIMRRLWKNPTYRKRMCKERKERWQCPEYRKHMSEVHKGCVGEKSPSWKGGKISNGAGYILIYKSNHPYPNHSDKKYVFEHRLIMEKKLRRYLKPEEKIHHIDGNGTNNQIKNLMLCANASEHAKFHYLNHPRNKNGQFLKS